MSKSRCWFCLKSSIKIEENFWYVSIFSFPAASRLLKFTLQCVISIKKNRNVNWGLYGKKPKDIFWSRMNLAISRFNYFSHCWYFRPFSVAMWKKSIISLYWNFQQIIACWISFWWRAYRYKCLGKLNLSRITGSWKWVFDKMGLLKLWFSQRNLKVKQIFCTSEDLLWGLDGKKCK